MNAGMNSASIRPSPSANGGESDSYHMCFPGAASTGAEDASPAPAAVSHPGSMPRQQQDPAQTRASAGQHAASGSSAPTHAAPPTQPVRAAAHGDPSGGEAPSAPAIEADLPTGSVVAPSGSGVAILAAGSPAASASPPRHHHATRLQHGISKLKTYIDGTVRWCMLSSTATEEPAIVGDALKGSNGFQL